MTRKKEVVKYWMVDHFSTTVGGRNLQRFAPFCRDLSIIKDAMRTECTEFQTPENFENAALCGRRRLYMTQTRILFICHGNNNRE